VTRVGGGGLGVRTSGFRGKIRSDVRRAVSSHYPPSIHGLTDDVAPSSYRLALAVRAADLRLEVFRTRPTSAARASTGSDLGGLTSRTSPRSSSRPATCERRRRIPARKPVVPPANRASARARSRGVPAGAV